MPSVYFARVGRYVKVGFSNDPEKRVARLWRSTTRYGRPWDLSVSEKPEMLATIDGDQRTEARCHKALGDYRSNGEWFIDEPGVRDFIARAQVGDLSPVARPGGPFEAVSHEQMLPERAVEVEAMVARIRKRARAAS